jgi:hypothetical protein
MKRKIFYYTLKKCSSLLCMYKAGVVVVNSKFVGLAPDEKNFATF